MLYEMIGGPMDGKKSEIDEGVNGVYWPVIRPHYKRYPDGSITNVLTDSVMYIRESDDKFYFMDTTCKNCLHVKSLNKDGHYWIAEAQRFTFEECPDCQEFVPTGVEAIEIE